MTRFVSLFVVCALGLLSVGCQFGGKDDSGKQSLVSINGQGVVPNPVSYFTQSPAERIRDADNAFAAATHEVNANPSASNAKRRENAFAIAKETRVDYLSSLVAKNEKEISKLKRDAEKAPDWRAEMETKIKEHEAARDRAKAELDFVQGVQYASLSKQETKFPVYGGPSLLAQMKE